MTTMATPHPDQCLSLAHSCSLSLSQYQPAGILFPTDALRGTPPDHRSSSPTPADRAARSYLINGWNDFLAKTLVVRMYMKEVDVIKPLDQVFSVKRKTNRREYHRCAQIILDMFEGNGNDADRVERGFPFTL